MSPFTLLHIVVKFFGFNHEVCSFPSKEKNLRWPQKMIVYLFAAAFGAWWVGCDNGGPAGIYDHGLATAGFDEYGYNDVAGVFNGPADGVDRNLDGTVWGDPAYANDHLLMKWNQAWNDCNEAGNTDPEACSGAWTINEWNGAVEGGSGETWHYKIVWDGGCGASNSPSADGGYCIWGWYAVLMSQGTFANQHFWDAHANPNGLGLLGG